MQSPRVELHLLQVGRCRHLEWVTIRGGRWRIVDFPSLVALIRHPSFGPILYDTGYADHFKTSTEPFPERFYRWLTPVQLPAEERLGAQLGRYGVRVEDVERVLISHFHADHVAGLRDLPRASFMALERDFAGQLGGGRSAWKMLRRGVLPALLPQDFSARLALANGRPGVDLGPSWAPFEQGYDLLGDRSLIGIPLPGHSPAQLGLLLRDQRDRRVLLAADACWSTRAWREQRMPSLLARPIFDDWHAYRRTLGGLRQIAERHPDLTIIPSHDHGAIVGFGDGA